MQALFNFESNGWSAAAPPEVSLIQNLETTMWELLAPEQTCHALTFLERNWGMPPIGTPFKLPNGKITSRIQVQLVRNTGDTRCSLYGNPTPPLGCVRRDKLMDSMCMNALRTGATAVVGTWAHNQYDHLRLSIILAFIAASLTYLTISVILYEATGFVGDSVSATQKIVLDKTASAYFYKSLGTTPTNDMVCLDLDNSIFWPKQNLYFAYRITTFAYIT